MTQTDLFADRVEGKRRKEAGAARVISHPHDQVWRPSFDGCCEAFLLQHTAGHIFTGEDLRRFAEPRIGQPHHPNAWSASAGGVLKRWQSAGKVERWGAGTAADPKAHSRLIRQYRIRPGAGRLVVP